MNIEISPKEYERELNWHDGLLYCQLLVIDGKNDWRMPTLDELKEIYISENDFLGDYYWSSIDINRNYAWIKHLAGGYQNLYAKNASTYVRAVRSLNF